MITRTKLPEPNISIIVPMTYACNKFYVINYRRLLTLDSFKFDVALNDMHQLRCKKKTSASCT